MNTKENKQRGGEKKSCSSAEQSLRGGTTHAWLSLHSSAVANVKGQQPMLGTGKEQEISKNKGVMRERGKREDKERKRQAGGNTELSTF